MIDKIILNIQHSDDYTDYLLMTAGLTNKRIIPMVNPSSEKLKAAKNNNSKVIRCFVSRDTLYPWSTPAYYDPDNGTIWVYSRCYLEDDGNINYARAEIARQTGERFPAGLARDLKVTQDPGTEGPKTAQKQKHYYDQRQHEEKRSSFPISVR